MARLTKQAVVRPEQVGQEAPVDVAGLDVAQQPHRGAHRYELGEVRRRLRPEALDRAVRLLRLGRVDADEPDPLDPAARQPDVQRVAVDQLGHDHGGAASRSARTRGRGDDVPDARMPRRRRPAPARASTNCTLRPVPRPAGSRRPDGAGDCTERHVSRPGAAPDPIAVRLAGGRTAGSPCSAIAPHVLRPATVEGWERRRPPRDRSGRSGCRPRADGTPRRQIRSMIVPVPRPPPQHMVTRP